MTEREIKIKHLSVVSELSNQFSKKISTKNITYSNKNFNKKYDIIIIAVAHDYIKKYSINKINTYLRPKGLILDLKSIFLPSEVDFQL